ncbi:MAG: type VI secretion system tip protein TssI/VgrG [Polyangiaceae bacterium]
MSFVGSFELFVAGFEERALRVVALRGRERLSRPYAIDVTAASRDEGEGRLGADGIGRAARLVIHGAAGARVIRGVVSRVRSAGRHLHDRAAWEIRIVPRLALLRHRRNSRIFQDRTVIEIVNAVLGEAMIPVRWETEQAYAPRAYCVQYEETDLEFVERVLAEVGAFYRFEHAGEEVTADAPEEVVIGDRARYLPIDGDPRLVYRVVHGGAALTQEERHVTSFTRAHAAAPLVYERRDHDFQRPLTPLRASAKVDVGGGSIASVKAEVYEHHSEFAEAESEQRLEETALSQLRREADVARGESQCVRLACGRRFALEEHEMASHDGEYAVTEIEHRGASPETAKEGRPIYENRFRAIPASAVLRPARRPRQMRQVMETAVVTGPEGQEINTDAYGRVKVQFRWDREGKNDERSSCWIRVAQAWSGGGWGFQFVPRIGMEVLVSFLGGDPDRPVVVGCVPDATHPVPSPLPENRTKSGIRTQSTPGGGGYNEILFDDAKGGELFAIRAERNLTETVMVDHRQTIGKDQSVTIAGSRDVVVRGAESLRVDGAQTWTVSGPSSVSVGGGAVSSVAGSRAAAIAGDDREMQPLWAFSYDPARPAEVGSVYCRVHDADYVGHQVADRIAWGLEEPGGLHKPEVRVQFQAGGEVMLPLTKEHVLWAFRVNRGSLPEDGSILWRLQANLDTSIVAVFVFDIDPTTGQVLKTDFEKVHDPKLRDELREMSRAVKELGTVPDSNTDPPRGDGQPDHPLPSIEGDIWGVRALRGADFWPEHSEGGTNRCAQPGGIDGAVGDTVDVDTEPARVMVVFSFATCCERADFEPGAVVGFARCYPHLLVSATVPVELVSASAHIDRPETLSRWHEDERDMSASCCKPPYDGWTQDIGSLLVTDANRDVNAVVPLPYWSNMFYYYMVDPYRREGTRKYHIVRLDRRDRRDSAVPLVRREVVIKPAAVGLGYSDPPEEECIVRKQPRQGMFDNVHMAPRLRLMHVSAVIDNTAFNFPRYPIEDRSRWRLDDIVMAPFCAHDCLHLHWRWGATAGRKWTKGWDASGPCRVDGAPLVPPDQDVWERLSFATEELLDEAMDL